MKKKHTGILYHIKQRQNCADPRILSGGGTCLQNRVKYNRRRKHGAEYRKGWKEEHLKENDHQWACSKYLNVH